MTGGAGCRVWAAWRSSSVARWAALALACLLAACSSVPERPQPTELASLPTPTAVRQLWMRRIGAIEFPLTVAVRGKVVAIAASDGSVAALQADSGHELWRTQVGQRISAGVGSDGKKVAVVTLDNQLVVLENGTERWRRRLSAQVLTAPLVAGERIFVHAADRSVHAFDGATGARLWNLPRSGDPLTLSQPGVLLPVGDTLVVGVGGRLTGLNPLNGSVRWDVALATPRGGNEIERLVDLVGPSGRAANIVCVRAYQAAVGCVNAERGTLSWVKPSNGALGVEADGQHVYGIDANDRITASRIAAGDVAWTSDGFLFRDLTAPLSLERALVFGDGHGFVHWLARDSGRVLARTGIDGSAIVGRPAASGDGVVVATREGAVVALRLE